MADTNPKGPERYRVVVSRFWHQPAIRIAVDEAGIYVSMDLVDFLEAVFAESATPEDQRRAIATAASKVLADMKDQTARVM